MLEPGEAYFCGNYRKCNNAEGCDECKEFEQYMNNQELNKYILIRYDNWINQPIVEGYFATVKEAKAYAKKNCLTAAISIYELAKDCKDLSTVEDIADEGKGANAKRAGKVEGKNNKKH